MSETVARFRRVEETGNVIIEVNDRFEMEFTPEQAELFAQRLLREAFPREHMFVIPITGSGRG